MPTVGAHSDDPHRKAKDVPGFKPEHLGPANRTDASLALSRRGEHGHNTEKELNR